MAGKRISKAKSLERQAAELRMSGGSEAKAREMESKAAELRAAAAVKGVASPKALSVDGVGEAEGVIDADTAISRRVKETLAKWGLACEVEKCLRGIIESTSVAQVEIWQAKLDGLKTVMAMYKTVAETEKKGSEIISEEGQGFSEVVITLDR